VSKTKLFKHGQGQQPQHQLITHQETVQIRSSLIPDPEIIAGYEHVLPGAADRILKMAETEQQHIHGVQTRNQSHVAIIAILGQVFGLLIGLGGIGGGVFLLYKERSLAGFSVFLASLTALVGVFIYQKRRAKAGNTRNQ
jgi:uncharacterized membrane protein